MNKVILCGFVGSIKDLHEFKTNNSVLRFSVATNDYWKNSSGEVQTKTQWHKVVAYNDYAQNLNRKLKVGDKIYIEGSLDYSNYTNRDNIIVPVTEIKIANFNILSSKEIHHAC